jgi:multidrug resistance efflux pump
MSGETKAGSETEVEADTSPRKSISRVQPRRRLRFLPFLFTLIAVAIAVFLGGWMWTVYMETPWTRDATVRAYVVTIAPEVTGRITQLPILDNQFVHKGDLLLEIDPTDYKIAVQLAEAAVRETQATALNAKRESERRLSLNNLAVTAEQQQTYESNAEVAQAQYQQAAARLEQARVNLSRTQLHSPVNGWITNLLAQLGDYANAGQNQISVINADSFWIDGYFEETRVDAIRVGDPVRIKLMGYKDIVHGSVESIARGINTPNAQPNRQGLASVNPIFTWVRLAQRIPVRIRIDQLPAGVTLAAGMTATVQIDAPHRQSSPFFWRFIP